MPDPNPSERLAEIEARVEVATPEPWIQDGGTWRTPHGYAMALVNWVNDADFIAHAREDIPWLLERENKLREALRHCGELALNRKTGAIQHLVKETLDVQHFGPDADSGEASGEAGS